LAGVVPEIRTGLALFRSLLDTMVDCRAVVDTAGIVTGAFGRFLKRMEIETLRPDLVIVIDRSGESLPVVEIAQRLEVEWILLAPEGAVTTRSPQERARCRARQFAVYFENASRVALSTSGHTLVLAAGGPPEPGRVVGLIDREGLVVCLGLFVEAAGDELQILAPLCDVESIRVIKIGRCTYRG
jgi:polynucleotide 5'-kinase involved in rRNA processing